MTQGRYFPVAGIGIALVTGVIVAFAGADAWLVGAAVLIWIGSFWLAVPPPSAALPEPPEGVRLTSSGVRGLIEHSGLPMVLLDGDRIIIANAAAREVMGEHLLGQDPRVAFRHPAAVDLLSRPEGGSVTIHGLTGPKSTWQVSRQPIDERYSLIELLNRTAEADISRAHTDFVANASHELRTPLASIIGYMETLADAKTEIDPDRAARFHTTVLREARRLQALVSDLMSLSRVEAEKHDQPREPVDLIPLVRQAARDGATPDRQDRLQFALGEAPLVVRGDRNQLEQLVRNLVENAFKYGSAEAPVTVSVERGKRAMASLSVRDRGEGIAAEHIPHLTRRFYRTDPGRSRAAGGTGLGLAIVKHIVERHRGQLDIVSELGVGTTVTVALPLAD
jgi:two-component system phosphate regulon sensor histidine kinase PhoR